MHGLINRAIQCFVQDSYGQQRWVDVTERAGLDILEFEAMLHYEDAITDQLIDAAAVEIGAPRETVLEDIGTYLVSHPNVEALRRLLRFGGVNFVEFLHSLDDLPDRARLAVDDLRLPALELREHASDRFSLTCRYSHPGFGHVMMGILRTLADDYGALVFLEHQGGQEGFEVIDITLIETAFARGRQFDLGARAG
ncbi:heme NO-binding domain-containing protein [Shimia sp. W99]|uniref:Haem-NO-binding n=1 Tax=Shimia aestuarii TaxID=254406 RepID=A0A1I4QYB1_9RHOB|nr:heme NO-binding domain-containing protein [Shimia aestuarii]SFM44683.1 Haem-NO-binding [Shimia aestuarii]